VTKLGDFMQNVEKLNRGNKSNFVTLINQGGGLRIKSRF